MANMFNDHHPTDPYAIEATAPFAQTYPLVQNYFPRIVKFFIDIYAWEDEDQSIEDIEENYGLLEEDFIYIDDVDRGIALGLPHGLYNMLFP